MPMSGFSLSSPFALFQSIVANDQDATSSSTSSNSAINSSLSLSPSISQFGEFPHRQQKQAFKFHNIEQTKQISKHLLELQREIKEEEDEIFADINSLINDRSNLDDEYENSVFRLAPPSPPLEPPRSPSPLGQHQAQSRQQLLLTPELDLVEEEQLQQEQIHDCSHYDALLEVENGHNEVEEEDDVNEDDVNDDDDVEAYVDVDDEKGSKPQQQQQHLLDELNQQQEQSFQEAVQQQQRDIQELTSNLPKPCVFFLEGNCRRSDCKFSHDLSSIICKYWIEGFCFKGEMCPFSHSLAPTGVAMLDENSSHLSGKALDPTFVIESEADFPSLPLDTPTGLNSLLGDGIQLKASKQSALTKTIKNQILSSNPTVVFKTTKKKRKKG